MERQVLVDARHPLVAPLFAAFQDRLYLYLEMEYCPGGSLDNFLRHVVHSRSLVDVRYLCCGGKDVHNQLVRTYVSPPKEKNLDGCTDERACCSRSSLRGRQNHFMEAEREAVARSVPTRQPTRQHSLSVRIQLLFSRAPVHLFVFLALLSCVAGIASRETSRRTRLVFTRRR